MKHLLATVVFISALPVLSAQAQQQTSAYGQAASSQPQKSPYASAPQAKSGSSFEKSAFSQPNAAQAGSSFEKEHKKGGSKAGAQEEPIDMQGGGIQPYPTGPNARAPYSPAIGSSDY